MPCVMITAPDTNLFLQCPFVSLKCTGEAEYTDDIAPLPGQLYAAFVKSTHANATIQNIDATAVMVCIDIPVGYGRFFFYFYFFKFQSKLNNVFQTKENISRTYLGSLYTYMYMYTSI